MWKAKILKILISYDLDSLDESGQNRDEKGRESARAGGIAPGASTVLLTCLQWSPSRRG